MAKDKPGAGHPHRPSRRSIAIVACALGLLAPSLAANHVQTFGPFSILFDHKTGNEWWLEVVLAGPGKPSVTRVDAMDTGGPWVALTLRSWGAWAGSFRIEPGHQVMFRATFTDASTGLSCWFTHPAGVEQCAAPPPPPPPATNGSKQAELFATKTAGGRMSSALASGGAYWNLWSNGHLQDTLGVNTSSNLTIVARGTPLGNVWPQMGILVDGVQIVSLPVMSASFREYGGFQLAPGGHTLRIAFTNDARSATEDRNLHVDLVRLNTPDAIPCTDPRGCPDLVVDGTRMAPFIEARNFSSQTCAVQEGMVDAGSRRLVRFGFTTPNLGPGDLFVGTPLVHPDWFDYAPCHGHHHFDRYADYHIWAAADFAIWNSFRSAHPDLTPAEALAATGLNPRDGHKQGFCVIDVLRYSGPATAKYTTCDFQGISVGWADTYGASLDGQWVDVTGLPPGAYVLEAEVNAERLYVETNYANNRASIPITL